LDWSEAQSQHLQILKLVFQKGEANMPQPREEQNKNSGHSDQARQPDAAANPERLERIRTLNDRLRSTGRGGVVLLTNGIAALGAQSVSRIFAAVCAFDAFGPDNDPWGEHDCATMEVDGRPIIWKIDYYDRNREWHSPDPADSKVTVRVLTVMLADEY
jgi:Protein of unknown function (DUF3768)